MVSNHSGAPADLAFLERAARAARDRCREVPGPGENRLAALSSVEVVLVDDETIARVHGDFLDDASATDVITFQHGEVLVSIDTAGRVSRELGISLREELVRYIVHGLLHLAGHDDHGPEDRRRMHAAQEAIVASLAPAAGW